MIFDIRRALILFRLFVTFTPLAGRLFRKQGVLIVSGDRGWLEPFAVTRMMKVDSKGKWT